MNVKLFHDRKAAKRTQEREPKRENPTERTL